MGMDSRDFLEKQMIFSEGERVYVYFTGVPFPNEKLPPNSEDPAHALISKPLPKKTERATTVIGV